MTDKRSENVESQVVVKPPRNQVDSEIGQLIVISFTGLCEATITNTGLCEGKL